ncbi:MAG: hypothetical protein KIT33_01385 [Candidatus Kapabacteria bacterium]|nr:hypothetical protein [Ignavibacteriota bacterium]MCW5883602.1 hypothetical protein [Candidatus Kapabacteria bacterium]
MKKSVLTLIVLLLGGCQAINVHLFDSSNAKIELFNTIINNPEAMDSIIKNSKFYHAVLSDYFFKNTSNYNNVVEFLKKNQRKKGSLLYNKKFTITEYPVENVYENGKDIYYHEISFIYEDGESDLVDDGDNVLMISFEFRDTKWCFIGLREWTKEQLDRLY